GIVPTLRPCETGFAYNRDPRIASSGIAMSTTIAIVATGEMGSAVGAALVEAGYRVVTDLTGRSASSRELAADAGIEDVGSFRAIAETAEIVLSILPPAHAVELGRKMAEAFERAGTRPLFVDCNAVSPATVAEIAKPFARLGVPFADVGIVGPAPRGDRPPTRFYVAGPGRARLLAVQAPRITLIDLGDEIGRASALKMCYAALNKIGRASCRERVGIDLVAVLRNISGT